MELQDEMVAAIVAILNRLPHGDYGPVRFYGTLEGVIEHEGHPETRIGFRAAITPKDYILGE